MFTGIVKDIGKVLKIKNDKDINFFNLTSINYKDLKLGSSISCNGVCITIIKKGKKKKKNWFAFTASKETLKKSNLNSLKIGSLINLETSLKFNNEISGHLVSGHIDKTVKLIKKNNVGSSLSLIIEMPNDLKSFISTKGSIAINGVSLTINDVTENTFEVNIIPHTLKLTNLIKLKKGDKVNIEFDIVGKYLNNIYI